MYMTTIHFSSFSQLKGVPKMDIYVQKGRHPLELGLAPDSKQHRISGSRYVDGFTAIHHNKTLFYFSYLLNVKDVRCSGQNEPRLFEDVRHGINELASETDGASFPAVFQMITQSPVNHIDITDIVNRDSHISCFGLDLNNRNHVILIYFHYNLVKSRS